VDRDLQYPWELEEEHSLLFDDHLNTNYASKWDMNIENPFSQFIPCLENKARSVPEFLGKGDYFSELPKISWFPKQRQWNKVDEVYKPSEIKNTKESNRQEMGEGIEKVWVKEENFKEKSDSWSPNLNNIKEEKDVKRESKEIQGESSRHQSITELVNLL